MSSFGTDPPSVGSRILFLSRASDSQRLISLFAENLRKLNGSTLIKGVTWDPVGEYLAAQVADISMKVWRTSDWKEEASIKSPFQGKDDSFFFRCTWSPEGSVIVGPNAVVGQRPGAVLIKRHEWSEQSERDSLLGHSSTVQVAVSCLSLSLSLSLSHFSLCMRQTEYHCRSIQRFNPALFSRSNAKGKKEPMGIVALGSDDHRISIWGTGGKGGCISSILAFKDSVMDLSWSSDGVILAASSFDGSVVLINFQDDFGEPMSKNELVRGA